MLPENPLFTYVEADLLPFVTCIIWFNILYINHL